MARTTKPLTNTQVDKAKPKPKEYNLSDGGGLALRVKPNGTKLWIFNYYTPFTKMGVETEGWCFWGLFRFFQA